MQRGDIVIATCYRGVKKQLRVWDTIEPGIQLCSEDEYQRAVAHREEPLFIGFPIQDVVPA